jgi:hypothetical protein
MHCAREGFHRRITQFRSAQSLSTRRAAKLFPTILGADPRSLLYPSGVARTQPANANAFMDQPSCTVCSRRAQGFEKPHGRSLLRIGWSSPPAPRHPVPPRPRITTSGYASRTRSVYVEVMARTGGST